jgi:hypothetical protein
VRREIERRVGGQHRRGAYPTAPAAEEGETRICYDVRVPDHADLARALHALAARFVDEVLALVAAHTGAEVAPARPKRPRLRRRTGELDDLGEAIVRLLAQRSPVPVRALAGALGTTSRGLARPLARLVAAGRVVKIGERKATVYQLPRRPITHTDAGPRRGARKPGAGSRRAR